MTAFEIFGIVIPLIVMGIEIPVFYKRGDGIDFWIVIISFLVAATCLTLNKF